MNGKEILDALNYVDDAYIEDADREIPRRRRSYAPYFAAAACLCLVLLGWLRFDFLLNRKVMMAESKDAATMQLAPAAAGSNEFAEIAEESDMISALACPSIRVTIVERNPDSLRCIVAGPHPIFDEGTEITVILEADRELAVLEADSVWVLFTRYEGTTVYAVEITEAE